MSKTQTISCDKCGATFAACMEPDCYTDKDWLRELKKYVIAGKKVDLVDTFQFSKCTCKKSNELLLFQEEQK